MSKKEPVWANYQAYSKEQAIEDSKLIQLLKDAPVAKANKLIDNMPVIISLNGKAYTLSPTEETDYAEIIKAHVSLSLQEVSNTLIEQVKQYATQVQKRVDELNATQRKILPPPPSLEFVLNNDIQIATKDGFYYYILPFSYRPKLLNGKKIQNPKNIEREVLIFFGYQTDKKGQFILNTVELRNYDLSGFEHYHSREVGNDCWGHGDFKLPIGEPFPTQDLPSFRDRLQNFLENVNGKSIATSSPQKLPDVHYLPTKSESVIWS
jgi:hypothetical protein